MLIILLFLSFATVTLAGSIIVPFVYKKAAVASEKRERTLSNKMEHVMLRKDARKMGRFFIIAPVAFACILYVLFPEDFRLIGVIVGITAGFLFPGFYIQAATKRLKSKFTDQLVDALMIMSSSFRGGLSLVQAIEAVVDEMPDPINKEFGTVLGENKMGVSLEDALYHLYDRIPSIALQQMITAILLARETGGNLPVIFNRIVTNIRERKKVQQNLDTLTVQGKIQGVVMALLPIGFGFIVYSANRRIFQNMLESQTGKAMLIYAIISELIGAVLIWKISSFKEF